MKLSQPVRDIVSMLQNKLRTALQELQDREQMIQQLSAQVSRQCAFLYTTFRQSRIKAMGQARAIVCYASRIVNRSKVVHSCNLIYV